MEPESRTGGRGARDTALWTVGGILLVAGVVLVAWLRWSESPGRAIAIALGTVAMALVLAVVARLCWRWAVRRRGSVLVPSVLVAAGALTLALFGIQAVREGDSLRAEPVEAGEAQDCATAEPDPLPTPPGDLAYDELPSDELAIRSREVEFITGTSEITAARRVLVGQRPLGFVIAAPGFGDEARRSDLLDNVRQIASRVGARAQSLEIGDQPAVLASGDGRVRLTTSSGCHAFYVGGVDERQVTYVARQLLGDPEPSG